MTDPQTPLPAKKRGCFFYGCIISLALFLLIVGVFIFAAWYTVHTLNAMVAEYTESSPMTIEQVDLPADEMAKLNARVDAFKSAMNAHTHPPPLVLTGPELDALLNSNPDMKDYKGCFFITLEGDEIKSQVSVPLDKLADQPVLKALHVNLNGRYFNGGGTFKAGIQAGELSVFMQSLEMKGKSIPANTLAKLQQMNLADSFNKNQQSKPFAQFESIQVKDGTLIITPKAN